MNHWTKSNIQGLRDFNDFELLKDWGRATQKGWYNESNWIGSTGYSNPGELKDYVSPFKQIPLFFGTKSLLCILVGIGDSSVTLPSIRLKLYDPDTSTEITPSVTASGVSASAKAMSYVNNGVPQYLYFSYNKITLPISDTYTTAQGLLIKRRVNVKVEYLDGATWKTYDFIQSNYEQYIKFIEIGPGFNNVRLPVFGQTIPADFYKSFVSMITGSLSGISELSGRRYMNYLVPNYKTLNTLGSFQNFIRIAFDKDSVFRQIINKNNQWSHFSGSEYYSLLNLVFPETGTYINNSNVFTGTYEARQFTLNPNRNTRLEAGSPFKDYAKWAEFKLIGNDLYEYRTSSESLLNELKEVFVYDNRAATGGCLYNFSSASTLPGYEESDTDSIYELFRTGVSGTSVLPVDNVSLSIIKNTLALPFWNKAINQDCVIMQAGLGNNQNIQISTLNKFFMELRPSSIGGEDIDIAGFKAKFYV